MTQGYKQPLTQGDFSKSTFYKVFPADSPALQKMCKPFFGLHI
jgi:hypothetical protein